MLTAIGAIVGCSPRGSYLTADGVQPFYLVGRPGFWGGFGSFLDIFSPQAWNYVGSFRSPDEVSIVSAYADWCMVGSDFRHALQENDQHLALVE
jgi:hypothetical protein